MRPPSLSVVTAIERRCQGVEFSPAFFGTSELSAGFKLEGWKSKTAVVPEASKIEPDSAIIFPEISIVPPGWIMPAFQP